MIWIIISAAFTFISGLSEKIIDLIHFKNNINKGRFKKINKWVSFIIFIVAFVMSIILIASQKKNSDKATFLADSLRKSDGYIQKQRSDSLKNLLNTANDTILSLNNKTQSLTGNQIRLLNEQKIDLLKTAKEIRRSADSLNKILTGTDGLCFFEPKAELNAGGFFSIVNINKYSLRNVDVRILNYRDLDSCVILFKNQRIFDLKKEQKLAIYNHTFEQLIPGLTPTDIRITPSIEDHRYYLRIEIGNNFYDEELYVSPDAKYHAYRLYKVESTNRKVLVKQSIPKQPDSEWKKIFNFNLSDTYMKP